MDTLTAQEVFNQSNGEVTRAFYAELEKRGPIGIVAKNLFRAQKTSTRAKLYRGRRFKSAAYDVKSYSMSELCVTLHCHGAELGITWGWKEDPSVPFGEEPSHVLYVDLPGEGRGQVSFHSPTRGFGPPYTGDWDGLHLSATRILAFADAVMAGDERFTANNKDHEDLVNSTWDIIEGKDAPPAVKPLRFGDPESIAAKRRTRC
jgi:hypothetical protein